MTLKYLTGTIVTAALCTAGCSLTTEQPPEPGPDAITSVVIVAGTHANSPRPQLSEDSAAVVRSVLAVNGTVGVVAVTGSPAPLSADELKLRPVKGPRTAQEATVRANLSQIAKAVQASPAGDGSDPWEAIHQAAGLLGANARNPRIIVIDSGLGDRGVLDFTRPGMLGAVPAEIVAHVKSLGSLPALRGVTVRLQCLGYTSAPQVALPAHLRANLTSVYTAVLTAAGGRVEVNATPCAGASVETDGHRVNPVNVPALREPVLCGRDELVFTSQSAVRFHGDRDDLIDPSAARTALAPLARWLADKPSRRAVVRGTTARSGSRSYQEHLGGARAKVVARLLLELGARPGQLATRGVGSYFAAYQPDRDSRTGELIPGPAAQNRSVRIATQSPC